MPDVEDRRGRWPTQASTELISWLVATLGPAIGSVAGARPLLALTTVRQRKPDVVIPRKLLAEWEDLIRAQQRDVDQSRIQFIEAAGAARLKDEEVVRMLDGDPDRTLSEVRAESEIRLRRSHPGNRGS